MPSAKHPGRYSVVLVSAGPCPMRKAGGIRHRARVTSAPVPGCPCTLALVLTVCPVPWVASCGGWQCRPQVHAFPLRGRQQPGPLRLALACRAHGGQAPSLRADPGNSAGPAVTRELSVVLGASRESVEHDGYFTDGMGRGRPGNLARLHSTPGSPLRATSCLHEKQDQGNMA